MKILQSLFCVAVAGLLSMPCVSFAQEASSAAESKTPKTQVQKKKKVKKQTFMAAVKANITDLTEDQKTKLETLQKEASASHKKLHKDNGITWDMSKKREEILSGLTEKKPYKERNKEASAQAGYSEDQMKVLKKVGEVYYKFRFNGMKVLTANQQAKMPQWYQDEFKKAKELATKEAAKKETTDKAAKAKTK